MERRGSRQQTGFGEGQQPRLAGDIIIRPNGRIIYPGESFRRSEPVPGTPHRKPGNNGRRGR